MDIKYVAGIRFTARSALQEKTDLPIDPGVLGQIIKDNEDVLAVVHEVFPQQAGRVGGQILLSRGYGSDAADDDRVR